MQCSYRCFPPLHMTKMWKELNILSLLVSLGSVFRNRVEGGNSSLDVNRDEIALKVVIDWVNSLFEL